MESKSKDADNILEICTRREFAMKYNFVISSFGRILNGLIRKSIKDKKTIKNVQMEYKDIILRAKDIGEKNIFVTSYAMGAYYLAMCRKTGLTPEENYKALEKGIGKSKVFKAFLGTADSYLSDKKMNHRKVLAAETHKRIYENDWVWDIVDKDDQYDGGYDYTECGVCKLFADEGAFKLAKYVCKLDYVMFDMMGITLTRTKTIADGDDSCDFRFKKQ